LFDIWAGKVFPVFWQVSNFFQNLTPKTISHHNQKTDLCNQKLFPAATKKDNGTTGMVGEYHLKLFTP
jgi:hypothetical protein